MPRPKRTSIVLPAAAKRLAGLQSIDPALDLGGGMSVATLQAEHDKLQGLLERYNIQLAQVDETADAVRATERRLRTLNAQALAAVKGRFGADSAEYQKAGGVRQSERKRPVRKPQTPPTV